MAKKGKKLSLSICGYCGKDTRATGWNVKKIILSGYANMLCFSCEMRLEDEIASIAKKYLAKQL